MNKLKFFSGKKLLGITTALCASAGITQAAINVWDAQIDLRNLPGDDPTNIVQFATADVWATPASTTQTRSYDIFRPVGVDPNTGRMRFEQTPDGRNDMFVKASVFDGSGGRWSQIEAERRFGTFRSDMNVLGGTSRSGDFALVAWEITFDTDLEISADAFSMRLASTNGLSELYEFAFVTAGTMSDAPFSIADFSNYGAAIYSDLSGSGFFGADGSVADPLAASGDLLPHGQSISQFLSGQGSGGVSGGLVQPGWYAIDDFNVSLIDGPEDRNGNPAAGSGAIEDDQTVTGLDLGLDNFEQVTGVTVWFGYYDVGFDTDGDGFTASQSEPEASIVDRIEVGFNVPEPLPEPTGASLLAIAGAFGLLRRRR